MRSQTYTRKSRLGRLVCTRHLDLAAINRENKPGQTSSRLEDKVHIGTGCLRIFHFNLDVIHNPIISEERRRSFDASNRLITNLDKRIPFSNHVARFDLLVWVWINIRNRLHHIG